MDDVAGKTCTRCGEFKPQEAYSSNARSRDGRKSACKECLRAENKSLRESNVAKNAERMKTWRAKNKDHVKEYKRSYDATNKDKKAACDKRTYEKHREERLAKNKTYRAAHLEFIAKLNKEYRTANPEKVRLHNKNVKHRRRSVEKEGGLTSARWKSILSAFNDRCAYCGCSEKMLEMDHVLPLSRGGKHAAENIVPACRTCNASKSNRSVAEWIASRSVYAPVTIPGWVEQRTEA